MERSAKALRGHTPRCKHFQRRKRGDVCGCSVAPSCLTLCDPISSISFIKFLCGVFRVSVQSFNLFAYKDNFTCSLPTWVSFISFYCLISVARTSKTILNSLGESGPSYLVPEFSRKGFSFSLLCVGYGFVISGVMLRYIPSISILVRVFIMQNSVYDVEFYQMLFLHLLRDCGFCLSFVSMVYHTD